MSIDDRPRAVATSSVLGLGNSAPDHLKEWASDLTWIRNADDYALVDESDRGVGWADPITDPLPRDAVPNHRSGTCFDVESTEMRAACVDPIEEHLGTDEVLHEVRHQRAGYHTDLVFAKVDANGLRERDMMTVGRDPIHDPLQRFRVWWYLVETGPKPRDLVIENGKYSDPSKNRKHLDWLLDHGYVATTRTGHVDAVRPPSIATLHAVELKLRDWETALEQAERANRCETEMYLNRKYHDRYGYADYRWVALDAGAIDRALDHRDRFEDAGVGLLAIAEGGTVYEHIPAEHAPRGRYTRDRAYAESQIWAGLDESEWFDESNATGSDPEVEADNLGGQPQLSAWGGEDDGV